MVDESVASWGNPRVGHLDVLWVVTLAASMAHQSVGDWDDLSVDERVDP